MLKSILSTLGILAAIFLPLPLIFATGHPIYASIIFVLLWTFGVSIYNHVKPRSYDSDDRPL